MKTLRQMKGGVLAAAAALVIIALAFFAIGRVTSPSATKPHVLGALLDVTPAGAPSYSPSTVLFTAHGPFVLIATCNPSGVFVDTQLVYQLQVFNARRHVLDIVERSCGNPNTDKATTAVVPENLPGGQYQVALNTGGDLPVSVLILDASPQ